MTSPAAPSHGYVYDLFRKLGLSDFGARTAQFLLVRPFRVALILVGALLVGRALSRVTERAVRSLHKRAPMRATSVRGELRTATMATALARLVRLVVWIIAALLALNELGLNLGPLLAGAGVVGVAVGLGAQSLVRDMVGGLFIISEDQYGVGDIVDLGLASGVVEEVNLRATRLRGADGTVWWVPNGQIQRVGNTTMEFSRAVVDICVPYGVDLGAVGRVMEEEAAAVAGDAEWGPKLLEPAVLWGAQSSDALGPIMRIVVTTRPADQYGVGRELRRRIIDRLSAAGLRQPAPVAPTPVGGPPAPTGAPTTR